MTKGRGGEGVGETEDILVVNAWGTRQQEHTIFFDYNKLMYSI